MSPETIPFTCPVIDELLEQIEEAQKDPSKVHDIDLELLEIIRNANQDLREGWHRSLSFTYT